MPLETARDRTNITAAQVVRAEAAALAALATRLETDLEPTFAAALDLLEPAASAGRPLFLTGIGKKRPHRREDRRHLPLHRHPRPLPPPD